MRITIILLSLVFFGCAQDNGRHIRCAPYIKVMPDGSRSNSAFWDLERDQDIDGSLCNEIVIQ